MRVPLLFAATVCFAVALLACWLEVHTQQHTPHMPAVSEHLHSKQVSGHKRLQTDLTLAWRHSFKVCAVGVATPTGAPQQC